MLRPFLLNVLLAVIYAGLLGAGDVLTFLIGFVIGFVIIAVGQRVADGRTGRTYARGVWDLVRFGGYFFKILVQANLQVAYEVITPGLSARPRFVRYPVAGLSDVELTALANAITLTPGTLTVDVDETPGEGGPLDRSLLIHCMYGEDRDAAIAELDALQDRMREEVFDAPR